MRGSERMSRAGFTLLELSLSLVIVTTIALGLGSAVVIASRAVPMGDAPSLITLEHQRMIGQMALDLGEATFFTERGSRAVGFMIPDRDGDGVPEHVRYAWDGNAGGPLTRAINRGAGREIIGNVSEARLAYATRTASRTLDGAWTAGSEVMVSGYETGNDATRQVTSGSWIGQRFVADGLPAGTARWCLTSVEFLLKQDGGASGDLIVRLEGVDGSGLPDGNVIAEAIVSESSLSSGWKAIPLQEACLMAGTRYALTLRTTSGSSVGLVSYDSSMTAIADRAMLTSDGSAWSQSSGASMLFRVRGAALTQGGDITISREQVVNVSGEITPGTRDVPVARVRGGTLNAPEVLEQRWDLGFERDPTAVDSNGDGTADWFVSGSFDGASLAGGVWTATQWLMSRPTRDFISTTTIDARVRDTTGNGEAGAAVCSKIDQAGGQRTMLDLFVLAQGNGSQVVRLRNQTSATSNMLLAEHAVGHGDFIDIGLTIVPDLDVVNLVVDGVEVGTFGYARYSGTGSGEILIGALGGDTGAQFDEISIRVSPAP